MSDPDPCWRIVSRGKCAQTGEAVMSVRSTIIAQFEEISAAQKRDIGTLTDDLALIDSGFDSLCFAILVAQLEDKLGLDPFSSTDDIEFPVTLGDFIALYENAASQ
jgi:acyl carrier protein